MLKSKVTKKAVDSLDNIYIQLELTTPKPTVG